MELLFIEIIYHVNWFEILELATVTSPVSTTSDNQSWQKIMMDFFTKTIFKNYIIDVGEFKSSHQMCPIKKGVLKTFAKSPRKHLCQSPFLKKIASLRAVTLLKRDYGTGIFLWILWNSLEQLFYRIPLTASEGSEYASKFLR